MVDENDNDSVEGIMFTKDRAVIMTGTFTNTYEDGKLNRMGLWYKPWFYKVTNDYIRDKEDPEPGPASSVVEHLLRK